MNYDCLCLKCMHDMTASGEICSNCGFDLHNYQCESNVLPAPSILCGRYLIGVPLGIGGFGITYIAFDMNVGGVCAIKEYMPDTVAYRM